jgi:uncharacterized protein
MKGLHMVTFLLLVVGGLNWLLVGVLGWDIGSQFLGGMDAMASRIIYILVGLSAIVELVAHKKSCRTCAPGGNSTPPAPPSPSL